MCSDLGSLGSDVWQVVCILWYADQIDGERPLDRSQYNRGSSGVGFMADDANLAVKILLVSQ